MKKIILSSIIVWAVSHNILHAQTYNVDTSFNNPDSGFGSGDGPSGGVNQSLVMPDGKILTVGNFAKFNGKNVGYIAKLNADGSSDNTFNNGGVGADSQIAGFTLQADGKIIIYGGFSKYNGVSSKGIARLNSDGTLDTGFNIGTGCAGSISIAQIQADGKIMAAGSFNLFNDNDALNIVRLNADGSIDTSFDTSVGANKNINDLKLDANGKIIICGNFTSYNGTAANRLARINTDGTFDSTFSTGTGFANNVSRVFIENDGKLLVSGAFKTYNSVNVNKLIRINTDGSLDTTFGGGTGPDDGPYAIVQDGNSFYVGGYFSNYNSTPVGKFVKIDINGTLDPAFNANNSGADGSITSILKTNDMILLGGFHSNYNGFGRSFITKLNTDGSIVKSFIKGSGAGKDVNTIATDSNDNVFIGGQFTTYNGNFNSYVAKLDNSGNLDTTFSQNLGTGFNKTVYTVKGLADGKIGVAGDYTLFNSQPVNRFIVLNNDGTQDTSFAVGTGFNGAVGAFLQTSDKKVFAGGSFTAYNGTTIKGLVKLNSDGTVDSSFNVGTGATGVLSMALQSDNKLLISGTFSSYNGTNKGKIARINTDGTLDNSFSAGTGFNYPVYAMALQTDGKILLGGNFTTFNGASNISRITRLNADGTLDTNFSVGTGLDVTPTAFLLQTDGKIIVYGAFKNYNGTAVPGIMRLNSDGTLDSTFNIGSGPDNNIKAITYQSDGKMIIGGSFTSFAGTGKNRIARLMTDTTLDIAQYDLKNSVTVYPNPFVSELKIRSAVKTLSNEIYDFSGKKVFSGKGESLRPDKIKSGVYILRSTLENGEVISNKIIKK